MQAGKNISVIDISSEKVGNSIYPCYGGNGLRGYVKTFNNDGDFPIIGRQGALCGNVNMAEGKFYATEHAVVTNCYNASDVHWAFYFLTALNLNQYATATAQPGLAVSNILSVLIPLPPYCEQMRIVSAIEHMFALIDSIESEGQRLQKAINLVKSKVLDLAIHAKLVSQDPTDEPAIELLKRINPNFTPCDTSHYPNLPKGWSICRLEDIVEYEQPTQYIVESTDYCEEYRTPVLTPGKSFILGYTNETKGIYTNTPTIIFDDFTTDSRYVDFPFKVKSSAMKILQVKEEINIKYVAYFMSVTRLVGDTHKRYWISEYSKIPIPIPPRKEQDRIVQKIQETEIILQSICTEL